MEVREQFLIQRYPRELRLRLKKYHENEAARDQGGQQHIQYAK